MMSKLEALIEIFRHFRFKAATVTVVAVVRPVVAVVGPVVAVVVVVAVVALFVVFVVVVVAVDHRPMKNVVSRFERRWRLTNCGSAMKSNPGSFVASCHNLLSKNEGPGKKSC